MAQRSLQFPPPRQIECGDDGLGSDELKGKPAVIDRHVPIAARRRGYDPKWTVIESPLPGRVIFAHSPDPGNPRRLKENEYSHERKQPDADAPPVGADPKLDG